MSALPSKRTLIDSIEKSAMCQKQTFRRAANSPLFDYLVGGREQFIRDRDTKRLCGFQVDDQMILLGLHYRQVGRLIALEDTADIDAGASIAVGQARPVADQAARQDEFSNREYRRYPVARRECGNQFATIVEKRIGGHDETAGADLRQRCESLIHIMLGAGVEHANRDA